jgi:hypothetical protein
VPDESPGEEDSRRVHNDKLYPELQAAFEIRIFLVFGCEN